MDVRAELPERTGDSGSFSWNADWSKFVDLCAGTLVPIRFVFFWSLGAYAADVCPRQCCNIEAFRSSCHADRRRKGSIYGNWSTVNSCRTGTEALVIDIFQLDRRFPQRNKLKKKRVLTRIQKNLRTFSGKQIDAPAAACFSENPVAGSWQRSFSASSCCWGAKRSMRFGLVHQRLIVFSSLVCHSCRCAASRLLREDWPHKVSPDLMVNGIKKTFVRKKG